MNTLKTFSLFSFCLFFAACGLDWTMRETIPPEQTKVVRDYYVNSKSNRRPDSESGKCYAQGVYTDLYGNETEQIFEFTGANYNAKGVKKETIIHARATTKWVQGEPDPGCSAPDPEDCRVMCLVDVPAVKSTYYIVTDTLINKEFKITEIPVKLINKGGTAGWVEVLCERDITKELIHKLNEQLINLGYLNENLDEDKEQFSGITKDALVNYQKAHGLPIGGVINILTLEHLKLNLY